MLVIIRRMFACGFRAGFIRDEGSQCLDEKLDISKSLLHQLSLHLTFSNRHRDTVCLLCRPCGGDDAGQTSSPRAQHQCPGSSIAVDLHRNRSLSLQQRSRTVSESICSQRMEGCQHRWAGIPMAAGRAKPGRRETFRP